MASTCGNCGAVDQDGAFCGACGRPLEVLDPTAQFPAPPSYAPPQQMPRGPRTPTINPFLGWPISDYVRDAAAAFFLFACLGMPWEIGFEDQGGDQWWVVIAVLLSVLSLAVPYVAKARLVPGWAPLHYRLVKVGLNVAFLASVLAALVNELVNVDDAGSGGLGSSIAVGLAGVALALQPRQGDEEPGHVGDRRWNTAARVAIVAALTLTALLFVAFLLSNIVKDSGLFEEPLYVVLLVVATLVMPAVLVAWPGVLALSGSSPWRRVFAASGFSVIVVALLSLAGDGDGLFLWPPVEKWNGVPISEDATLPGGGILLLGVAAALVVSRAQARLGDSRSDPLTGWAQTAAAALKVSAAGSGVFVVCLVLDLVVREEVVAANIVLAVLAAAAAGGAGFALTLLGDPARNRLVLLGVLAGIIVLGFIVLGVVNAQDIGQDGFAGGIWYANTGWTVAAWLALPGLAAYALTVPRAVRERFGPLVPTPGPGYPTTPPPGYAPPPSSPPPASPPPPPPPSWEPPPAP